MIFLKNVETTSVLLVIKVLHDVSRTTIEKGATEISVLSLNWDYINQITYAIRIKSFIHIEKTYPF